MAFKMKKKNKAKNKSVPTADTSESSSAATTADSGNFDPNSPKATKFRELMDKRVNNLMNSLRLVGQLHNKTNYTYSQEQVDRIFTAVRTSVDEAEVQFRPKTAAAGKAKFAL